MGRTPINAMKKEDIVKLGKQGDNPMPPPKEGKQPGPKKSNSENNVESHDSGWM